MKKLLLLLMLGALAVNAQAQTTTPQVTVPPPASDARLMRMAQIDFGKYQGGYELANGKTLYLLARGARMYAQIDDGERHEMGATGEGKFVTMDRSMKMHLETLPGGELAGELLIARGMTAGEPQYEVLVARR